MNITCCALWGPCINVCNSLGMYAFLHAAACIFTDRPQVDATYKCTHAYKYVYVSTCKYMYV